MNFYISNKIILYLLLSCVPLLHIACNEVLLGEPEPNTVLNNYEVFVADFQDKYGLLQVKGIDWARLTAQYQAPLEADPTNAALYEALTGLIGELNDSHLFLLDPEQQFPFYDGGRYGELDRAGYVDFDFEIVRQNYLSLMGEVEDIIYHGSIGDNVGYIHLPQIYDEPDFFETYMPGLLVDLKDTRGIIIDLRDNNGGEDESSRTIASHFAQQRALYMISRYKTGPGENDFEEPREWLVEPVSNPYTRPVILLTNRYSISAAETFSFAMKTQPQVTQVGDTTSGAFSDVVDRQLPNGWVYGLSVGDYRNRDNQSLEGIGIVPDLRVVNSPQDLLDGVDKMLEAAIAEIPGRHCLCIFMPPQKS